jgi:hypothetical protein
LSRVLGFSRTDPTPAGASAPFAGPAAAGPKDELPRVGRQRAGSTITTVIPQSTSSGLGAVPLLLVLLLVEMLILGRRMGRRTRRGGGGGGNGPRYGGTLTPAWN